MSRAFTRPRFSWQARTVPPMLQLLIVSKCFRCLLKPGSPGRQELCRRCCSLLCSLRTPWDFTLPGVFWQAGTCRRCCSLYSLRTPRTFTLPGFSWQARTVLPILQLVQSPNTSGLHFTRFFSGRPARTCRRCCSLCSIDSTHNVPSSIVP